MENIELANKEDSEQNYKAAEVYLSRILSMEVAPTAAVLINDHTAMHFIKAALHKGLSIPGNLSVTGFDNASFSEFLEVPLTTVEQKFSSMGQKAAEIIIQHYNSSAKTNLTAKIILDTELIIRQSTTVPMMIPV